MNLPTRKVLIEGAMCVHVDMIDAEGRQTQRQRTPVDFVQDRGDRRHVQQIETIRLAATELEVDLVCHGQVQPRIKEPVFAETVALHNDRQMAA